jgi:uncharacterized protein (DUF305 family)
VPPDTGDDDSTTIAAAIDPQAAEGVAEVLPWYHSWINLAVVALAIAVLAGGLGYVIGNNRALPDPNDTDVGFLQDMRYHHEQAVTMGLIFVTRPDTMPGLRTIAREIVVGQELEIGRMVQLLRDFGESEINETDVAMTWMGDPTPLDRMPGLAAQGDLEALNAASGADADELFVRLMVAHHQGGLHMAEHAADHAGTTEVRRLAASMVIGQTNEIEEMQTLVAAAPSSG